MLTEEMQTLIRRFSAGAVASVNADGTPSVSPKGTFVILDSRTLAFGHIRSPGTVANLRRNPAVEVCFTDVVTRRAVRVTGTATIVRPEDADAALDDAFECSVGPLPPPHERLRAHRRERGRDRSSRQPTISASPRTSCARPTSKS